MKETSNRPFILNMEDAKKEIIQSVNNAVRVYGLPFYLVDLILADVYAQVREGVNREMEAAKAQEDNNDKQGIRGET